jgi:hypothetical protein
VYLINIENKFWDRFPPWYNAETTSKQSMEVVSIHLEKAGLGHNTVDSLDMIFTST